MKAAAIILMSIGLFVLFKDSEAKGHTDVWKELSKNGSIPYGGLATYLDAHNWTTFGQGGMTAIAAEEHVADKDGVSKDEWDALTGITDCIRAAE